MPPKNFPIDPSEMKPLVSERTPRMNDDSKHLLRFEVWVVGILVFLWFTAAVFRLRILP